MKNLFQIRATGILIENEKILIVKQKVSANRLWSLPGGRVEHGETMEEAIIREMREETGLQTKIDKLLYVSDKLEPPLVHITFLLHRVSGRITLPSNEFDENPILDVKMVSIDELITYHFSKKFMEIVKNQIPKAGSYQGDKHSIGL